MLEPSSPGVQSSLTCVIYSTIGDSLCRTDMMKYLQCYIILKQKHKLGRAPLENNKMEHY